MLPLPLTIDSRHFIFKRVRSPIDPVPWLVQLLQCPLELGQNMASQLHSVSIGLSISLQFHEIASPYFWCNMPQDANNINIQLTLQQPVKTAS